MPERERRLELVDGRALGEVLVPDDYRGAPVFRIVSPMTGDWNVHVYALVEENAHDNYEVWEGRGDLHRVRMFDESGGAFDLCIGFHKGTSYLWFEAADFPKDDGEGA